MIVWEAGVKGDLSMPALETSSRESLGQLAPHLAPREDLCVTMGAARNLKSTSLG